MDNIKIPKFSIFQLFLITFFDVDFSSEKFVKSKDPETLSLRPMIKKYSLFEMLKMYF
jgi:hypothetical protein